MMSSTDFLKDLRKRYGDISVAHILKKGDDEESDKGEKSDSGQGPTPPPPPPPTKHPFLPINIGGLKDWCELREIVLGLQEFINFFVGKQDSQSPQFLDLIDNYKKDIEKRLSTPKDFDESTSSVFVKNIAEAIEKRFYMILKACKPGLEGRGKQPRSYYQDLDLLVKKYFKNIGLASGNVRPRLSFRDWREHMKVSAKIDTPFDHLDNIICEVEVQPHYFKYINDTNEEEEFWIDGECSVYKKRVMY